LIVGQIDQDLLSAIRGPASGRAVSVGHRVRDYFRERIRVGEYPVGTRLPTVRYVAQRIGTTPQTVAAAYRLLSTEGLVRTRAGAGTTVLGSPERTAERGATPSPLHIPLSPPLTTPSYHDAYRRLLQLDREASRAAFAAYVLPPDLVPDSAGSVMRTIWRRDGRRLLEVGPPEGDPGFRAAVKAILESESPISSSHSITITNGAQEGLALIFRAIVGPGDTVLVENPGYLGALELLASVGARVLGVPMRPDGPDLDVLEEMAVRLKPRLFYTMPSCQNPTGYTMSIGNRRRLLALARRYEFLIVEDAATAAVSYTSALPASLLALDQGGSAIRVGSFSKTLFPGIRVGYVVGPRELQEPLVRLKWVTNLHTPLLNQRLVQEMLVARRYVRHVRAVRDTCRARRDTMLRAIARELHGRVTWTVPDGGFSVWLSLAEDVDATALYRLAIARGVSFVPGAVFFASNARHNTFRLCFAATPPDVIERGIGILGEALHDLLTAPAKDGEGPASLNYL
jgi:GntR family transcriptional regulator / MocR family aminotransferase